DSVCAATDAGIGSSDVMRLAAPSLRPSRRFVGTCGVSSELSVLSFMEIAPSLFRSMPPCSSGGCGALHCATRQKTLSKINSVAPTTLRLSSTVIIMGLCLCGLRQGRAIISCELFNSLAGQLMLNVKALPWLVEIKLLIEDRLAVCGV